MSFWRKNSEPLEQKCNDAIDKQLPTMREINPYEACVKCPHLIKYGAIYICDNVKYNRKDYK